MTFPTEWKVIKFMFQTTNQLRMDSELRNFCNCGHGMKLPSIVAQAEVISSWCSLIYCPLLLIQSLLMLMAKKGFHNAPQLGTLMRSYVLVRPKIGSAKYMRVHFSSYRFFHMKVAKVLMGCHWAHRPWISMDFQHTQTS